MKELRSWGEKWGNTIPQSKAGWRCRNIACNWHFPNGTEAYRYLAGFVHEPTGIHKLNGKLIFKCPKCSELFWSQASIKEVQEAMESDSWPKEEETENPDKKLSLEEVLSVIGCLLHNCVGVPRKSLVINTSILAKVPQKRVENFFQEAEKTYLHKKIEIV